MSVTNLIVNSNFDTGIAGWTVVNAKVVNGVSHTGTRAVQLTSGGTPSSIQQSVPVTAGDQYELRAALSRGAQANPQITLAVDYFSGATMVGSGLSIEVPKSGLPSFETRNWRIVYGVTAPVPANATTARIKISLVPSSSGLDVYVDDVMLLG